MALATVHSYAQDGLSAPEVAVEVHLSNGLPSFTLVGLPDTEVKEARDRVRAAIVNSGFEFPRIRITVNLAPADLPKESGRFDLPIAIGILAASHQIPALNFKNLAFAGELSLSGELRPIRGALALLLSFTDKGRTPRQLVLPSLSAQEATLAGSACEILAADSLQAVCLHLRGETPLLSPSAETEEVPLPNFPELADVKGQHRAKRALEIAACGQHSLLMLGPPGSGKSMLAARLPSLLPPLDMPAARRSAAILSLAGRFSPAQFRQRIFRSPHHTASAVALVGGGNPPRPGEISLATDGFLFLDELPEFDRRVLESLREPLETGKVHIARAGRYAEFPARFQLVAAMNPCPCGWLGHPGDKCQCSAEQIRRYRGRLSGPLLDRIDLQISVPAVPPESLQGIASGESSSQVRDRVCAALERQQARQGKPNALLNSAETDTHCVLDEAASALLRQIIVSLDLSARTYHRILRVARSIADLTGEALIQSAHIAEASQLRRGLES